MKITEIIVNELRNKRTGDDGDTIYDFGENSQYRFSKDVDPKSIQNDFDGKVISTVCKDKYHVSIFLANTEDARLEFNEELKQKLNLVCTVCGAVLMKNMDEDLTKSIQAGHCNRGSCDGKLEWKPVS